MIFSKLLSVLFILVSLTACNDGDNGMPEQADQLTDISHVLISPASTSLPIGLSQQLTAEIHTLDGNVVNVTQVPDVNWSSDDESIATVSNDNENKGKITGHSQGIVTITVSGIDNGQLISGTAQIEITDLIVTQLQVTPYDATTPIGLTSRLVAEVTLSNGQVIDVTQNDAITWNSDDTTLATVSNDGNNKGNVTGVREGTVVITASGIANGQSFSETIDIEITNAIVNQLNVEAVDEMLPIGLAENLSAIALLSDGEILNVTNNDAIIWSSSDTSIAKVNNRQPNKGMVTGITNGTVTITASGEANNQLFTDSIQIEVTDAVVSTLRITQENVSIAAGITQNLYAEATMSDGQILDVTQNSVLSWSSSDNSIATMSNNEIDKGKIVGLSTGLATITASGRANGQLFSDSIQVEVTSAVVTQLTVASSNSSLPKGLNLFLTAEAALSNGQTLDVTQNDALSWSSSDLTVASVSNNQTEKGMVTGLTSGTVTLTASGIANGQAFSDTIQIDITEPVLQRVEINASSITITEYFGTQLQAFATYSDGTSYNVTTDSQWQSESAELSGLIVADLSVMMGYIQVANFIDGKTDKVKASYLGVESEPVSVTMITAQKSLIVGQPTAYTNEISSDLHNEIRFQGGSIIDGIYDAETGELLAGGYGGGLQEADREVYYSDQMVIKDVTYIKGISGTQWSASNMPILQILEWDDGTYKKVGKLENGDSIETYIPDSILGIIVYTRSLQQPSYVSAIQFIYK
ncbi:Ig-like domain-containing protein [Vibrio sp. F74]|uniref:Ig-like domain-containing protein n=1 Tax=Vibrio sp. F74 TaxID=700020 RepID=UPI0035F5C099